MPRKLVGPEGNSDLRNPWLTVFGGAPGLNPNPNRAQQMAHLKAGELNKACAHVASSRVKTIRQLVCSVACHWPLLSTSICSSAFDAKLSYNDSVG